MEIRRILLACTLMILASTPAWADTITTRNSDRENMGNGALVQEHELRAKLEEAQAGPERKMPDTFLIAIPEIHYTKTRAFNTRMKGTNLSHDSGQSQGAAMLVIGRKQLTETWGVGALYHYVNIDYDGGILVPKKGFAGPGSYATGSSKQTGQTHMLGLLTDYNFKEYGRVLLVAAHSWDYYDGHEKVKYHIPAAGGTLPSDRRSLDQQKSTLLSVKLWYEIDAHITENFTVTPYVGYRFMYATVDGMNDWNGEDGDYSDLWVWHHMGQMGTKFKYRHGLTSVTARVGYSRRLRSDPIVGYAGRFTDQTVCHLGYNVNYDRNTTTFGLGVEHVIPERGILLGLKYDGMAGAKIDSHSFGATFALMF